MMMCFLKKLSFILLLTTLLHVSVEVKAQKGTLQDIKFLAGSWQGEYNGGPINGSWTAPQGDNIVGYLRMMKDDKVTLYEIFAFEQTPAGPVAHVKHFKPGLISLEDKEVSDTYYFLEAEKNAALFEKSDASVRIKYVLKNKSKLIIQRGVPEKGQWTFTDLFIFKRL